MILASKWATTKFFLCRVLNSIWRKGWDWSPLPCSVALLLTSVFGFSSTAPGRYFGYVWTSNCGARESSCDLCILLYVQFSCWCFIIFYNICSFVMMNSCCVTTPVPTEGPSASGRGLIESPKHLTNAWSSKYRVQCCFSVYSVSGYVKKLGVPMNRNRLNGRYLK